MPASDTLINLIEIALVQLELYVTKYEKGSPGKSILSTKKVLLLLKDDAPNYPNINKRLLRAAHDIGIAAVKVFDQTTLEDAIMSINRELWKIPGFSNLKQLGMDFGKGDPI